jgi:rhomboid-related protein 1/2/3
MNVIFQLSLGIGLELVHGWWRVCLIYLSGVLAGSIGTSIFDPKAKLVGASGGVYALITG